MRAEHLPVKKQQVLPDFSRFASVLMCVINDENYQAKKPKEQTKPMTQRLKILLSRVKLNKIRLEAKK